MTPKSEKHAEGRAAFRAGKAVVECPYSFANMGLPQGEFDTHRWNLDAWMKGWLEAKAESQSKGRLE